MKLLARLLSNHSIAWIVVITVLVVTVLALFEMRNLENEDDMLTFMPEDNPDIQLFYEINDIFGGLDVALVGIKVKDPFDAEFLTKLTKVTSELNYEPGLNHVLSLANVVDFSPNVEEGGIITAPLVQKIPTTFAEKQELRKKVMARDHIVGNLISEKADAAIIYAFLAYGTDPKQQGRRIRNIVEQEFSGENIYWGGGPFIATYVYDMVKKDLCKLVPWALLVIIIIIMIGFRDIKGVILTLGTTLIGIIIALGLMPGFGIPFNIMLAGMPIILFAIGTAYCIHLLTRYYELSERYKDGSAMARALIDLGPVIIAAALTTAVSLFSFVFMDIPPIRAFGVITGIGILIKLVLTLTFIPSVVQLTNMKRKQTQSLVLRQWMVRLCVFARTHRFAVGSILIVLVLVGSGWITKVNTRVDNTTFFTENSPPAQANYFLRDYFGGSQYLQIYLEGDLSDPHVLREVQRIADRVQLLDNVSRVEHASMVLALSNEAMAAQRRIPDTRGQVRFLYGNMMGDPSLVQLVTSDRTKGLMQVKIKSNRAEDMDRVIDNIAQILDESYATHYEILSNNLEQNKEAQLRKQDLVRWRVQALCDSYGVLFSQESREKLESILYDPVSSVKSQRVEQVVLRFLRSEECALDLSPHTGEVDIRPNLARELVAIGDKFSFANLRSVIGRVLQSRAVSDDLLIEDLAVNVNTPLREFWRDARAHENANRLIETLNIPNDRKGKRFIQNLAFAFWDLENPSVMVAASPQTILAGTSCSMRVQTNGEPVLYRGMSDSVEKNQVKSLVFALMFVVIILAIVFRSLWTGVLATCPTIITLVMVYGAMGLMRVHLDIGTSLLASIILGIGVDYAVHLVSAWSPGRGQQTYVHAAACAADRAGPAIWTNAIMVFAGFFILTLGQARPLKNVGGLTAAAMLIAALATFFAIPVLARKIRYKMNAETPEDLDVSNAVGLVLEKVCVATDPPSRIRKT